MEGSVAILVPYRKIFLYSLSWNHLKDSVGFSFLRLSEAKELACFLGKTEALAILWRGDSALLMYISFWPDVSCTYGVQPCAYSQQMSLLLFPRWLCFLSTRLSRHPSKGTQVSPAVLPSEVLRPVASSSHGRNRAWSCFVTRTVRFSSYVIQFMCAS